MSERNPALAGVVCPVCAELCDAGTCVDKDGATPKPDDLTVCIYCRSFLKFSGSAQQLGLTLLTLDEIADLPAEARGMLVRYRQVLKDRQPFRKPV